MSPRPRRRARRRPAWLSLILGSIALSIGLVSHRASAGGLDTALRGIVDQLLAKPPQALRETQRLLRHGRGPEIVERMKLEGSVFAERLKSPEVEDAISAFFAGRSNNAKRTP